METNEIMETKEIITEAAADIAESSDTSNGFTAAAVGIGMLAGMLIYKYAVIPITARIKAKKAAADAKCAEACDIDGDEDDESDDD